MSERLYASFMERNPRLAEPTYRHIWRSLQEHDLGVSEVRDPQGKIRLPQAGTDPNVKLRIDPGAVLVVGRASDREAQEYLGLDPRADKRQRSLLPSRQVLNFFRELEGDYTRTIELINPYFSREKSHTWRLNAALFGMHILYKFTQLDPNIPSILQGRMVDLMAVPFAANCLRGAYMLRPGFLWTNLDRVSSLPPVQAIKEARNFKGVDITNISVGLGLILAYGAEINQLINPSFGVFDPGDFAAYTAGGLLYAGYQKLREKIVTLNLTNTSTRKKK